MMIIQCLEHSSHLFLQWRDFWEFFGENPQVLSRSSFSKQKEDRLLLHLLTSWWKWTKSAFSDNLLGTSNKIRPCAMRKVTRGRFQLKRWNQPNSLSWIDDTQRRHEFRNPFPFPAMSCVIQKGRKGRKWIGKSRKEESFLRSLSELFHLFPPSK